MYNLIIIITIYTYLIRLQYNNCTRRHCPPCLIISIITTTGMIAVQVVIIVPIPYVLIIMDAEIIPYELGTHTYYDLSLQWRWCIVYSYGNFSRSRNFRFGWSTIRNVTIVRLVWRKLYWYTITRKQRQNTRFPPNLWNGHEHVLDKYYRTNNYAEAANRRLNVRSGVPHSTIWAFITYFRKILSSQIRIIVS